MSHTVNITNTFYGPAQTIEINSNQIDRGVFLNPNNNLFYRRLTISIISTTLTYPFTENFEFDLIRRGQFSPRFLGNLNQNFDLPFSSKIEITGQIANSLNNDNIWFRQERVLSDIKPPGNYTCSFQALGLTEPNRQFVFGTPVHVNYICSCTNLFPIFRFNNVYQDGIFTFTYSNPAVF
jgi:hypothetical protein